MCWYMPSCIVDCMQIVTVVSVQYVCECRYMEEACEGWARELVCRCVFRAWQRATATSRREGWERERRAKMHHIRSASLCTCLSLLSVQATHVQCIYWYRAHPHRHTSTMPTYIYLQASSPGSPPRACNMCMEETLGMRLS